MHFNFLANTILTSFEILTVVIVGLILLDCKIASIRLDYVLFGTV